VEFAGSAYCRESWLLHLAELRRQPEGLWHKCDHGRFCALVPVACDGRCLAAIKLVCLGTMPEETFERNLELLEFLVREVMASEADFLAGQLAPDQRAPEPTAAPAHRTGKPRQELPNHPRVRKALEYIEEHLSDPKLTVGHIALGLNINADYLAHLFATQVGERMSQYIAARRVELAKTLLATTDWQIKRVAGETGHANPRWFSHVFHTHTGLTPGDYRRGNRGP
jgi:AraC-like DNA-binding protein